MESEGALAVFRPMGIPKVEEEEVVGPEELEAPHSLRTNHPPNPPDSCSRKSHDRVGRTSNICVHHMDRHGGRSHSQ